jgi:ABC-type glycerol-3-phosphate transport system substrate-binding protein
MRDKKIDIDALLKRTLSSTENPDAKIIASLFEGETSRGRCPHRSESLIEDIDIIEIGERVGMKNKDKTPQKVKLWQIAAAAACLCVVMGVVALSTGYFQELSGANAAKPAEIEANLEPDPVEPEDTRTTIERLEQDGWSEGLFEDMIEENNATMIEDMKKDELIIDESQTGDLVLWLPPGYLGSKHMVVIDIYKEMYPNVNIEVFRFRGNHSDYITQVSLELMAGKGPDILFPSWMFNTDGYKAADAGAFLDLNPFIEQDEEFNIDDYIKGVMDGGVYNGKRYVMPLEHRHYIMVTVPQRMDEIGFDYSQMSDTSSFMNEIMRVLPKAQENPDFMYVINEHLWNRLYRASGIKLIDYETKEVLPDEESLRQLIEAYKPYHDLDGKYGGYMEAERILFGNVMFMDGSAMQHTFMDISWLKGKSKYQLDVIPGMDGKIHSETITSAAIRSGSPNAQNAWNYIKLLLSPRFQSERFLVYMPVHKDTIIADINEMREVYDGPARNMPSHVWTKLTEEEMQEFIDIVLNVDHSHSLFAWPVEGFLGEQLESYYKGEISLDTAIERLRNTLKLYVSE